MLVRSIHDRIEQFDRTYSRFRDDSLVASISRSAGTFAFPDDAAALFDVYRSLYEATDGRISPLVGNTLEALGYDREYSLREAATPVAVPSWSDSFAWDRSRFTAVRPVLLDVGAAGKGYLADLVGGVLATAGVDEFVIDASGDILHRGGPSIRVGLEHPADASKAIGVVSLHDGALCASAPNRRAWGNGLHHLIDATTGRPTSAVVATWALAESGLIADGLATALFVADPARLAERFVFQYVKVFSDGRVEFSRDLDGELFL